MIPVMVELNEKPDTATVWKSSHLWSLPPQKSNENHCPLPLLMSARAKNIIIFSSNISTAIIVSAVAIIKNITEYIFMVLTLVNILSIFHYFFLGARQRSSWCCKAVEQPCLAVSEPGQVWRGKDEWCLWWIWTHHLYQNHWK